MIIHGHQTGSIRDLAALLQDCPVQLRWGGPQVPGPVINGRAALLDGLGQLENLQAAGVRVPEFTTSVVIARSWIPTTPVYARSAEHSQGRDIILALPGGIFRRKGIRGGQLEASRQVWEGRDFWTKWVPSTREWRFHILRTGGQYTSIGRAVKVWDGDDRGEPPGNNPAAPCVRSRRLGWHMAHDVDPPEALREAAKRACAACGYDLGAVDLLETPSGPVVLEVNSRPALRDPYTLERYAAALRSWRP